MRLKSFIAEHKEWYRSKGILELLSRRNNCFISNGVMHSYWERLSDAIARDRVRGRKTIIAEYKRASPLEIINLHLPLRDFYHDVAEHVSAFSILVDHIWFMGSPTDIASLRMLGWKGPVLAKGFVFYREQIDLYRSCGASAVLLIYRALDQHELDQLYSYALATGIEPLVEVNTLGEALEAINRLEPRILGVNSRNLDSLEIDRDLMLSIVSRIKREYPDIYIVAESGVRSVDDLKRYIESDADSLLIGTALMRPGSFRASMLDAISRYS